MIKIKEWPVLRHLCIGACCKFTEVLKVVLRFQHDKLLVNRHIVNYTKHRKDETGRHRLLFLINRVNHVGVPRFEALRLYLAGCVRANRPELALC